MCVVVSQLHLHLDFGVLTARTVRRFLLKAIQFVPCPTLRTIVIFIPHVLLPLSGPLPGFIREHLHRDTLKKALLGVEPINPIQNIRPAGSLAFHCTWVSYEAGQG